MANQEGTSGHDVIHGDADGDRIEGGAGYDFIYGGSGADELYGGEGKDHLFGGEGDDTLVGGASVDHMTGGAGADTFVFGPGHGYDYIHDFTDGEDVVDLTALTGISGFEDLTITAYGEDAIVDLTAHGGGHIHLRNVDVADLDANDFLFYVPTTEAAQDGM